MHKRLTLKSLLSATALAVAALAGTPASGTDQAEMGARLRELAEPYHTEALWAADEIKKRTNGRIRDPGVPGLGSSATRTRSTRGSASAPSTSSIPG